MDEELNVLIVEDNPGDVDLIRDALSETDSIRFHIESVPRLSEARTRLAAAGIDLVMTDLGLPDSQGLATFRNLRQVASDFAIIVLTANNDQEMAVAAVREGAQDFLVKSQINRNLLIRAVRYAIERKRVAEELLRAFHQIKTLRGILPICFTCKKVRDDKGYWGQVEDYVRDHSEAQFSHSVCPECMRSLHSKLEEDDASVPKGDMK